MKFKNRKFLPSLLVCCLLVSMILSSCGTRKFDQAAALFEEGKFDEAEALFLELEPSEEVQKYLDQMGWARFHAYLEEQGDLRQNCSDSLAEFEVNLKTIGNTIEAEYVLDISDDPSISMLMRYTVYLEPGKETAQLKAQSEMTLISATFSDTGSTDWDIVNYSRDSKGPHWDSYENRVKGTTLQGDPVEPNPDLGMCREDTSSHDTAVKRLVSGIEKAVKESGLSTTMADLGFRNY